MKIGMLSLGCPKNLVDSEVLLGHLQDQHQIVNNLDGADVGIINTCSFIGESREESIQMLLQLVEMKKAKRLKHIVVCGCLPQKFSGDLERDVPEIDAMIGTFDLDRISQVVRDLEAKSDLQKFISPPEFVDQYHVENRYFLTENHTKYLKISEGCDHTCTFCIIPQMRGKHRSRPMDVILREAQIMAEQGTKELILIGQDTSFYGVDTHKKRMLPELLRQLNEVKGIEWIRVLYVYPINVNEEMLTTIAECDKVCNYIDMPLQHINNRILSRMRRNVTREKIVDLIQKMRSIVPNLTLRTTFIVGFPGETYEEFNELLDFVNETEFERMGAFMFSDETDAESFSLDKKVSEKLKKERFQDIMLLQQDISKRQNKALIGKEFDVLIDGDSPTEDGFYSARTYMDAPDIDCQVLIEKSPSLKPGDLIRAKITQGSEYDLEGKVITY